MKHLSPSCIVTILLTSLAATAAFVPLSNRRTVAIPSFSYLSTPATTTTTTTGVLQMRSNNDDVSPQRIDAAVVLSNLFAAASICMAAITVTGSAILLPSPANAVDASLSVVSPSIVQTMATTTTIAEIDSTAPSLVNFLQAKKPTAVVYSPKEGTLQTSSPTLSKFLNCKLIAEPDVGKKVTDSITLVLNNKLIFLTGTVGTITAMYYFAYQLFLNENPAEKA